MPELLDDPRESVVRDERAMWQESVRFRARAVPAGKPLLDVLALVAHAIGADDGIHKHLVRERAEAVLGNVD
jgi:hypothetical protein